MIGCGVLFFTVSSLLAIMDETFCLIRDVPLKKKFTLRLPIVVNVGGKVNPMGDICTESVDMLLSRVNSQSNVLPDYNVVVDMVDDECTDAVALRRLMPVLENWGNVVDLNQGGENTAVIRVPVTPQIINNSTSSKIAYTPPLLLTGACSSSCKVTGKLPQHFNLVEIASGCIDSTLDNRLQYPNFYRLFRSVSEYSDVRIRLAESMGWHTIAILSDTTQYTYQDTTNFMRALNGHGLRILSEEFFKDNPRDAVSRLKERGARIIFAICYVNTCPAIACEAHRLRYFGPEIVWIFNSEVDVTSRNVSRPEGCEPWMIDEFSEGSLYTGADFTAASSSEGQRSEIGINATEITDYIRQQSPDALSLGAVEWRFVCFEMVHNAIYILDKVDRTLRANDNKNETLLSLISSGSSTRLVEMLRNAILTLNIDATWGKSAFSSNMTSEAYVSPPLIVQQMQGGVRKLVLVQKRPNGVLEETETKFVWKTETGSAPRSEPLSSLRKMHISEVVLNVVRWISAIFVSSSVICSVVLIYCRKRHKHVNSFPQMNFLILSGSTFPLFALLSYPEDGDTSKELSRIMGQFCVAAPILVLFGFLLTVGGLAIKIWVAYLCRNEIRTIRAFPKVRRLSFLVLLLCLIVNCSLLIALFTGDGAPSSTAVIELDDTGQHAFSQNVTYVIWVTCSSKDFTFGWIIVALTNALAVSAILVSLIASNSSPGFISDIIATRTCLYVLWPIDMGLLFATATIYSYGIQLGTLSAYAFLQCVATQIFIFALKFQNSPDGFALDDPSRMTSSFRQMTTTTTASPLRRRATVNG